MMGQSCSSGVHLLENLRGVSGCLPWGVRMGRTALDPALEQAEGSSWGSEMLC